MTSTWSLALPYAVSGQTVVRLPLLSLALPALRLWLAIWHSRLGAVNTRCHCTVSANLNASSRYTVVRPETVDSALPYHSSWDLVRVGTFMIASESPLL